MAESHLAEFSNLLMSKFNKRIITIHNGFKSEMFNHHGSDFMITVSTGSGLHEIILVGIRADDHLTYIDPQNPCSPKQYTVSDIQVMYIVTRE